MNLPKTIENIEQLEELLSEPCQAVVETMRHLDGDILFLGAAGKIGPSLARMAGRASRLAGTRRRIIAVSRFSIPGAEADLHRHGIETIRCDLLEEGSIDRLPDVENVVYLAGLKFGSAQRPADSWASNTFLPSLVCRKYQGRRIVAFSTGAVYGLTSRRQGGSREGDPVAPVGEYAMSCLGRERMFEYFSRTRSVEVALIRLFYACELRYGVLVDLARTIAAADPIDLSMSAFNIIWQGDNNRVALRALERVASPPFVINVTGPEILSIRETAEAMGRLLGKTPIFRGVEHDLTCLGNAARAHQLFGPPNVPAQQLMEWVADWVSRGQAYLGKPTHFEVRDGKY